MTGQRLIDKGFCRSSASAALQLGALSSSSVVVISRKEFAGCAKPFRTPRIASVPWLAEDELAAVAAVAQVEPVRYARIPANQVDAARADRGCPHN